jgi:hypothetical protein
MATFAGAFLDHLCMEGLEIGEGFTVYVGSSHRYVTAGCMFHPGCEKMSVPRALHIIDCKNMAALDASGLLTELFEQYF